MNKTIKWKEPIEAYHEDGRVKEMTLCPGVSQPDGRGYYTTLETVDGFCYWRTDGSHWADATPWRIRNCAPETAPVESALRAKSTEPAVSAEMVERLAKALRPFSEAANFADKRMIDRYGNDNLPDDTSFGGSVTLGDLREARAILSELEQKLVDPLVEALQGAINGGAHLGMGDTAMYLRSELKKRGYEVRKIGGDA